MRIPNLSQMIDSVEADNTEDISIESIIRNHTNHDITLDLISGLDFIEYQLHSYLNYDAENPIVCLSILDTIDKWVYRENRVDIHHAIMSVVYESIKGTDILPRFENYLRGGPFPLESYQFEIKVLLDAIAWLKSQHDYAYLGET